MSRSLEDGLGALKDELGRLPEAREPPPTTLQVLGRNRQERDWQQFLFHFLTPENAHGLDRALLKHFLKALSDRDDFKYRFSTFDLDSIRMQQEVMTDQGRPDALIWSSDDWFVLFELKVDSTEGEDQTPRYTRIESFRSIDLDAEEVASDEKYYVFLAPGREDALQNTDDESPEADEFVRMSWEWVASELQSFLVEDHGAYPARTTAQLEDFIDTIRTELTMTEYQENQQEKVELYVEHYDEIAEVEHAFDERWERFTETWGEQLATTLGQAKIGADEAMPEEYVAANLELNSGERTKWVFRQGKSDWSWIFRMGWWTKLDESRPVYDTLKPNGRVGFLHRLDQHRDDALKNHELVFYLRNAPSGHDDFYHNFAKRFNTDPEIPDLLPSRTSRPSRKSNVLEARYPIDVEPATDFFDAYIQALANAMDDHVISNPELVEKIERLCRETLEEDISF